MTRALPQTALSTGYYLDADSRWQAVRDSDPRAADAFVYAVKTTGVYCRPTCAARLPRRENVSFHDNAADAERSGFRPCRRCRPDRPPAPSVRREIRYAIAPSVVGQVLVAASARGICALLLGDKAAALTGELGALFPRARLVPAGAEFATWMSRVLSFIEHPERKLDLPLDMQGSPFALSVWRALREIPAGQTVDYGEVARRLGRPGAARAVARACAANRLAVVVPCHRVVRADGGLSGYRWGAARKRALLSREAAL